MAKHCIIPEDAPTVWKWFAQRGGIAVWNSESKTQPNERWTSPMRSTSGHEPYRPHKWAGRVILTITDPNEVDVRSQEEVSRVCLYLRRWDQGLLLTLMDATGDKLREALTKAKQEDSEAWHEIDFKTGEAIIYVPYHKQPLPEYMERLAAWNREY